MPKKPKRIVEDWDFVLPDDQKLPPEQQTVFRLRPLNMAERMRDIDQRQRVVKSADGEINISQRGWQQLLELFVEHVITIDNFPQAPKPYPGLEADRDDRLKWINDNLHHLDVGLVGIEVRNKGLLEPDLKNS